MKRPLLLSVIALLAITLIWLLFAWDPQLDEHAELRLGSDPSGGDFTLHNAQGPVALQDYRGKVVLLYFGYTWCPDICPTSLALMAQALKQLTPKELQQVQGLFVSVDPERDTPKRLATYTAYFHPDIMGITGSPTEVATAARLYGASYRKVEEPGSATGYSVDHSSVTYLIDQQGKLRRSLAHGTPSDQIVSAVRALLNEHH